MSRILPRQNSCQQFRVQKQPLKNMAQYCGILEVFCRHFTLRAYLPLPFTENLAVQLEFTDSKIHDILKGTTFENSVQFSALYFVLLI